MSTWKNLSICTFTALALAVPATASAQTTLAEPHQAPAAGNCDQKHLAYLKAEDVSEHQTVVVANRVDAATISAPDPETDANPDTAAVAAAEAAATAASKDFTNAIAETAAARKALMECLAQSPSAA
ncbi:hypothetical protein [Streptomyces sp. NBC_01304]|uniref:hypothetical protein n=1 Tax=Streptomyces sp. NBC_01304 TaxID=2903818 RepID=UPI002E11582D|nr:hypothetical protein OG430_18845 [Streptomyces sp. NBC_01304]